MPRCPYCRGYFAVLEDEDPRDHGCPSCGYSSRDRDDDDDVDDPDEDDE